MTVNAIPPGRRAEGEPSTGAVEARAIGSRFVDGSGGRYERPEVIDGCVQSVLQGRDVSSDLSEKHAALVSGEEHVCDLYRVDRCVEATTPLHLLESFAEDVYPLFEDTSKLFVDIETTLEDLARERAKAAPALEWPARVREEVHPALECVDVIKATELIAAMELQHVRRLPVDHTADEALLVREVVTELRAADAGGVADQFVVRRLNAAGVDQLGCVSKDPIPRRSTPAGELLGLAFSSADLHKRTVAKSGLDSPVNRGVHLEVDQIV